MKDRRRKVLGGGQDGKGQGRKEDRRETGIVAVK